MTTAAMTFFTIDTLQFSKRLHKAGLDQKVSEELAEAIKDSQEQPAQRVATKSDISILEQKIENIKNELLIKMFFMFTLAVAVITWLDKIVK